MKITHMIILVIVLVLMTGCTAFDSVPFTPNQYNLQLDVTIVPTEDFTELEKKYKYKDLGGLTEFTDFKGKGTLYIPMLKEVRDPYTMCILGHEVFHLILGHFHKPQDGATCYWYW